MGGEGAFAHQLYISKVSVVAMNTLLEMKSLAQLARSWSCAFSASGSVNGERRVLMALWWKPMGRGGSPGPVSAAFQASQMSAASSGGVATASSWRRAVWLTEWEVSR